MVIHSGKMMMHLKNVILRYLNSKNYNLNNAEEVTNKKISIISACTIKSKTHRLDIGRPIMH